METTNDQRVGDLAPDVMARRTATMLVAARVQSGFTLRSLARRSGGSFTKDRLREIESGSVALDRATTEALASLYGCELDVLFTPRRPVVVDGGSVSAGGRSERIDGVGATSVLSAYLRLVRALRRVPADAAVELRRDDIEVLAVELGLAPDRVVEQLAELLGAQREERATVLGLFHGGATVIGLVGTAVAAGSGIASRSALVRGPLHQPVVGGR